MNRSVWFAVFLSLVLAAAFAQAGQEPMKAGPGTKIRLGGNFDTLKTARDSVYLIGPWSSPAPIKGQFEAQDGFYPDWNGWTHHDLTTPEATRWNVSTYHADNLVGHGAGNLAAWCGESIYPACTAWDEDGGYGNNYDEILSWTGTVADPDSPCTVTVDAWMNYDLEFGYDFVYLRYHRQDDYPMTVMEMDGQGSNYHLQETFVVQPDEFLGNLVKIEFRVASDGAYSAEDCFFPNVGAVQIDDITVTLSNGGQSSFEDFQSGETGAWQAELPQGVGDFAHIYGNLGEIDPCVSNWSPQVLFIDDGIVIPETGGQVCINWCYGPGGYIVNTQGGLAGPESYLHNQIRSPIIPWPATGAEGAILTYDVYEHEDLSYDSPGIFHTWHIRSTTSADPGDIVAAPWRDRNYVYYGPGQYIRPTRELTDLLEPGTTYAQVAFAVWEAGYYWGFTGDDGYPAPYFDNVRLVAYPAAGPKITARQIDLAQDGFPASGALDQEDPTRNSVRFDMAANIASYMDNHIDPGDSIVVSVVPVRDGAVLMNMPRLRYRLKTNPDFDPYRISGLPAVGSVLGAVHPLYPEKFAFDLPDTGFFFPGDVLHYFIEATSILESDQLTATLPVDTTGFSDFSSAMSFDLDFTVRALPSVSYNTYNEVFEQTAKTLLWVDGGDLTIWAEYLEELGQTLYRGFDIFQTRGPSSGAGNGLGSRTTPELMDGYETLLYTSGIMGNATIANGDLTMDGSDDVGLLDAWMNLGDKSIFLTGDNLVSDLYQSGVATQAFATNWMKVSHVTFDVRPFINNQVVPRVLAELNEFPFSLESWIAYGGCPFINTFDGVEVLTGGQRIAEFTDPSGIGDVYPYAAATMNDLPEDKTVIPSHDSAVIFMPYDFQFLYTDPNSPPPVPHPARNEVLYSVLSFFGEIVTWGDVEIPGPGRLEARNYPNPFNPATKIDFHLPKAGHLSVKVFNVRGQLVRTLIDEKREAGPGNVLWDGSDDRGAAMSSGVYFYELRTGGEVIVQKMALLK